MRQISAATLARLEAGELVMRDFFWIGARNRTTGDITERGWWSDVGTVQAQVIDATDTVQTRTYIGGAQMVEISPVPLVTGLTVQTVDVRLSIISPSVEEAVREWDVRRAPVEIHRGLLDPSTYRMAEPAIRRFVGFVDEADIRTPEEGSDGATVSLTCASHTQELLRSSSDKRSDASQRRRNPNDGFFRHANVVSEWQVKWVYLE